MKNDIPKKYLCKSLEDYQKRVSDVPELKRLYDYLWAQFEPELEEYEFVVETSPEYPTKKKLSETFANDSHNLKIYYMSIIDFACREYELHGILPSLRVEETIPQEMTVMSRHFHRRSSSESIT